MDRAKILDSVWSKDLRSILATEPFLPESCIACYVSEEETNCRVLLLEEAWIHFVVIEQNPKEEGGGREELVTRYSVAVDSIKSIETEWKTDDTFMDAAKALERSRSSCKAIIVLEHEVSRIGERLMLPLKDSDYGDSRRAAKESQAFVKALLSTRSHTSTSQ